MDNYDAIVIGSGFGGLAAGLRLLAAGHKTLIVERHEGAGGRARTFLKNGFTFDAGPTVLTGVHMFEELFQLFGRNLADYVDLLPIEPFYKVFDNAGQTFNFYQNETQFIDEVGRFSPSDVSGAVKVLDRTKKISTVFYPYTEKPMLKFRMMMVMLPYLIKHNATQSVRRLVRKNIKNPFIRTVMEFHPLLIGGNPANTPSLYSLIEQFERDGGVKYARGGTTSMVAALKNLFVEMGGEFRANAPVRKILHTGSRVHGIELMSDETISAKVVVSNVDPKTTYLDFLGKEYTSQLAGKWTSFIWKLRKPSMSLYVLYFGLDKKWPETQLHHHSILLSEQPDESLRYVFNGKNKGSGRESGRFLYVHMPTLTDNSVAPDGCDSLYVLVSAPAIYPANTEQEEFSNVRADVIKELERYLPGFESSIAAEHHVDPKYFRDELGSAYGAAFGILPSLLQSAWFRPHNRSPRMKGLYFVGAGTHPGAGVPAVIASAKIATGLISQDIGK